MKILMLSDVYFPRVNGVSTSIAHFRGELQRQGHEVWLIAPRYPETWNDDPHLLRLPSMQVPRDPEDRLMSPRQLRRLLPRLREVGFDLVHVQTPFVAHYQGLWLARQLGVPCVETYHTFFEEYGKHYFPFVPKSWLKASTRAFSRRQGNSVDGLISPSLAMAEALRAYGVTTPIEILPTGIELAELESGDGAAFRARLGLAPETPTLVFVGRVAKEKNLDFLLDVLDVLVPRRPDVVLLVAGDGPALPWLKAEVARRGLEMNVRFVGYLSRRGELQSCYRAGDVFAFASRTETQGLVLLEAMALGVPVLALAVMGTRDILLAERGCVIAEDDVADFAAKAEALLGDPARRKRLGEAGREYVKEWTAEAMTTRLVAFYRRLTAAGESEAAPRRVHSA